MKLDFLKSLQEQGQCGLRTIIEPLHDQYPVLAHSDWKEMAIELVDSGYIRQLSNSQYKLTPAGAEAINKGAEFINAVSEDNESKHAKRLADAELLLKPPLMPKQIDGGFTTEPAPMHAEPDFDDQAESLVKSMETDVENLTTDELLEECRQSQQIIDVLTERRIIARAAIKARIGEVLS